jgi:hypothetical protein
MPRKARQRGDREERRREEACRRPPGAPSQRVDEEHAQEAEAADEGPSGQVGRGPLLGADEGDDGRQEVVEEAGILVEAVVQIPAFQHVNGVRDEEPFVELRAVPEPPPEPGEAEQGRDHEDPEEGKPPAHLSNGATAGRPSR